jgi:hypothetical protein
MADIKTIFGTPIGEHREIDPSTGLQKDYIILTEAERAKGFVRPVRLSYRHVGPPPPKYFLRDLTPEEKERYAKEKYVKYEEYPRPNPSGSSVVGRFYTQEDLNRRGCGTVTKMGLGIAETYARDPSFYTSTYCAKCLTHLPIGADGEFVWYDTNERVGT